MNTQDRNCIECGGLILEPHITYGYVGRVCYCSKPKTHNSNQSVSTDAGLIVQKLEEILSLLRKNV